MKLLDEKGLTTVWSVCKEKFALAGHTHNYAGSGSAGGSANSAIGVVDYGQTDKTIQIGYSGAGITGGQIKFIAGYTDGGGNVSAKIKDVSKDALKAWLGLGSLAYSSASIPTKLSQLTNDKGFVTGSVSGNTVTINGTSTTWSNTWRGIQDNLTSSSTSESLSANQGRVLKGLVDGKVNSSDLSSYAKKNETIKKISTVDFGDEHSGYTQIIKPEYADGEFGVYIKIENADNRHDGFMSRKDKAKLDGIAYDANNYTLHAATADALGGIRVNNSDYSTGWPVITGYEDFAFASIPGLSHDNIGNITSVRLQQRDVRANTEYNIGSVRNTELDGTVNNIYFPSKSGILALKRDCNLTIMGSEIDVTGGVYMVGFKSSQQTVLLEKGGNYNISNWYNQSSVGDVLDMYPYGLQGGIVTASQSNLFRVMKVTSGHGPQLLAVDSISLNYNKHIRMIRTSGAVFACTYTLDN